VENNLIDFIKNYVPISWGRGPIEEVALPLLPIPWGERILWIKEEEIKFK